MLVAAHQVGRLLEARGRDQVPYAEFIAFRSSFQEKIAKLGPGVRLVVVADLRGAEELSADVAPAVLGMLRADNARVERSAHLVTPGTSFSRQYDEIVDATRNPMRQVFITVPELVQWLSPVLTSEELVRLRAILG